MGTRTPCPHLSLSPFSCSEQSPDPVPLTHPQTLDHILAAVEDAVGTMAITTGGTGESCTQAPSAAAPLPTSQGQHGGHTTLLEKDEPGTGLGDLSLKPRRSP